MGSSSEKKKAEPPASTDSEKRQAWDNYCNRRHDTYAKQREGYSEEGLEVSGRFDKAILLLPAGAIAYSLTFLEKIAPAQSDHSVYLIGIAWIFLICSLLSGLYAILWSQYAINMEITTLDAAQKHFESGDPKEFNAGENKYSNRTNWCNQISMLSFTVGLILLCLFAFASFPKNSSEKKKALGVASSPAGDLLTPTSTPPPRTNPIPP